MVKNASPSHVVLEMFGGDNNLSRFVQEDILEMVDGMEEGFTALCLTDYEDQKAKVIEVSHAGQQEVEDLGEINTGDPAVLANFLSRALVTYSAVEHVAIGFWDHGSGVFDEDDNDENLLEGRSPGPALALPSRQIRARPRRRLFFGNRAMPDSERAMLHDDTNGGVLTNREAGRMLQVAFAAAGMPGRKVDMIFSDTCLNGMIEVLSELAPYAHVITGSEDLEPGDGWDYQGWFELLRASPPEAADRWGFAAVEAFGRFYEHKTSMHPCTLGAFKTQSSVVDSFRKMVEAVSPYGDDGFDWMRKARDYCQSFDRYATYDLRHFGSLLEKYAKSDDVKQAARTLFRSVGDARVHSVAYGSSVPSSNGVAFWFPPTRFSFVKDATTYRQLTFDRETGWSNYLMERYNAEQ